VAARIGYDPFFAWARKTIVVSIAPSGERGFAALVYLVDEQGVQHGARELKTNADCGELLSAAALAIAIAIDPRSLAPRATADPDPEPNEQVASAPTPTTPAASPDRDLPQVAPPRPASWSAAAPTLELVGGAVASTGVAPLPAFGLAAGAAVRWGRASLDLEGRVDAPTSAPAPAPAGAAERPSVSSWLLSGTMGPCLEAGRLLFCALGQVGALHAMGQASGGRSTWTPWVAAGARFGVRVPIGERLAFRVRSDLLADLIPPALVLNGVQVWAAPRLAASLGVDVVAHFQ
jgi:hypothetical protein